MIFICGNVNVFGLGRYKGGGGCCYDGDSCWEVYGV